MDYLKKLKISVLIEVKLINREKTCYAPASDVALTKKHIYTKCERDTYIEVALYSLPLGDTGSHYV